MMEERIAAFVRGESEESFETLALDLFRYRYERHASVRAACAQRGTEPHDVTDWRQVPAAPASAAGDVAGEGGNAGEQPDQALLQAVIDRSFPVACLTDRGPQPVLSLIPSGENAGDPALASLAHRVLEAWAASDSAVAAVRRGVEAATARSFLAARQRDRRATLILATSMTLRRLLETLERRRLRFRLPPGSRVVEAGGVEGNERQLLGRVLDLLAVPAEQVVLAYGANGLATRLFTPRNRRGELRPLAPPPWVRARVLDPRTGSQMPEGAEGALAVFDLAAPGPAAHLLTGDRAMATEDGVRLLGSARAA